MSKHLRAPLSLILAVVMALTAAPAVAAEPLPDDRSAVPSAAEVARPANDNFANATTIPRPGRFEGTTVGATRQPNEPRHASQNAGGHSVWWTWTAAFTRDVVITTRDSNFDTLLGVYRGRTLRTLRRIASDDDVQGALTSRVEFRAFAGNRYRIAVDGFRYTGQTGQTASAGHVVLRVVNA
jgi:hypothetical protein